MDLFEESHYGAFKNNGGQSLENIKPELIFR
jgi:hypothetical protein